MKKIVGILAGAAVLASSVFAADISAKVRLEGSLFKFNADKSMSAMEIEHAAPQHWNPVLSTSVNGDVAGAEVSFYAGTLEEGIGGWNKYYTIGAKTYKIWFSPMDGLKINLGNVGTNLNQEMIDWSNTDSGVDSEGYGLAFNKDAIGIDLILCPGWGNNWMNKADGGDLEIGTTYFKFNYNGGDIGTINAMLRANATFKDLAFGVGYKNTFSGITVFENVLGYMNNGFNKVRSETYAQQSIDAFTWQLWVPVDFTIEGSKVAVGTIAKLSYALDACTAYLYVKSGNWLADSLGVEIKPGVTGSVGAMGWEVAADVNVAGSDVSFNVPVNFTVNF